MRAATIEEEWKGEVSMSHGRPAIFLLGVFGVDNLGNEASLEVMLAYLRWILPHATLRCICSDPAKTEEDHGVSTIPIRP